jgi:hypothetical protein
MVPSWQPTAMKLESEKEKKQLLISNAFLSTAISRD